MYGVFNLTLGPVEDPINISTHNHLTKDGMKAILNRKYLPQPNVNGPSTKRYANTLNYFFVVIDDGQPLGFDLESLDVTFAQIARFPNNYSNLTTPYSGSVSGRITFQKYPEGQDSVTILAVGMGYKEVGGDGSNDFVWSISKLKEPYVATKLQEYEDRGHVWAATYSYNLTYPQNSTPRIKTSIDGVDYTFVKDSLGSERGAGYIKYVGHLIERNNCDVAGFTINGAYFTPPTEFKEIKTTDPLIRKFEISYQNKRTANAVDLTGFAIMLTGALFSYRLPYDKYIVLQPGKTFKITIAVGIERGVPAGVTVNNLDFVPSVYYNGELGNVNELISDNFGNRRVDTVYVTGSAGTANEKLAITKLTGDNPTTYISDVSKLNVFNTELTKIELGLNGKKSAPIYTLAGGNPTVIPIQKPDISASDNGWHVINDKIIYRINVPADITHLQVALDDGVWYDFPVTAGISNDIELSKRFIYNNWFFLRWKNGNVTGVITKFNKTYNTGAVLVEPFRYYGLSSYLNNPDKTYYQMFRAACSGYPSNLVQAIDDTGFNLGGIPANPRGLLDGGYEISNYNGTWPNTKITLLQSVKYFQSDLTFKAVPELTNYTFFANGDESALPWKIRATPPVAGDVAVTIPRTNVPRSLSLDLKPYPTAEAPNTISLYGTLETRKAQITRITDNQVIATAEAPENGQLIKFTLTDKLFNHLDYGVDYLNEAGVKVSPAPALFKGASLDVPAAITDYAYDDQQYIISFTTPDRAVRASIKQYDIEVFSFECVQGGVTKFYMSKPLNMTQRYELWLYNANGETWSEPYVMVDVEEVDEKPTSTGPYTFPEWSAPSDSDVVAELTGTDNVFADVQRWVKHDFRVRINGSPTDQVITRNQFGIITNIAFNSLLYRFVWSTGYNDASESYDVKPTSQSGISVTYMDSTNPIFVIDVWHEWEKYAVLDEASFGRWNYGTFNPYYGQTTGKFQKTEITNGYIRNTVRIRFKPAKQPRVCPLWHLVADKYSSAFRNAMIFIHATDLVGMVSLNPNANYYPTESFQAIIDGKAAKWDLTKNEQGQVIKARCFNDDLTSFSFDGANPSVGWKCDNYDPAIDGTEGADQIYHTLQFCRDKGYWDGQIMSYAHNSLYGEKMANVESELDSYSYSNAIFAKVHPYARIPEFDTDMGGEWSTIARWENNPQSVNQEFYRFQDAYLAISDYALFSTAMNDSVAYMDGEKCTITTESVTIPYTPSPTALDDLNNSLEPNPSMGISDPVLEPFTYTAFVITGPNYTVSNRSNPYIWKVDGELTNDVVKLVIARKKFSVEPYPANTYSSSKNTNVGGMYYSAFRQYWAGMALTFHKVKYKLLITADEVPDVSNLPVDQNKAIHNNKMLQSFVRNIVSQAILFDFETYTWSQDPALPLNLDGFIKIDGAAYNLVIEPDVLTVLTDKKPPIQRDILLSLVKVVNATDPTKYIAYDYHGNEQYVGIAPGVHTLSLDAAGYTGTSDEYSNIITDFMANLESHAVWKLGSSLPKLGFINVRLVNYVVSDIRTGFLVNANAMPFKVLDEAVVDPDFQRVFPESFAKSAQLSRWVDLQTGLNAYHILKDEGQSFPDLSVTLNGRSYDNVTIVPVTGDLPTVDLTDITLTRSIYYQWNAEAVVLGFHFFGEYAQNVSIHLDATDVNALPLPVTQYEGDQLAFSVVANTPSNDTTPIAFTAGGYEVLTPYGLPITSFEGPIERIDSVVNGKDVFARLEIVIGKPPVTDIEFDPDMSAGVYANLSETALLELNPAKLGNGAVSRDSGPMLMSIEVPPPPPGGGGGGPIGSPLTYVDDATLVPNWYQYPSTLFDVKVNGKAAQFIAGAPAYGTQYSNIRLDTRNMYINWMGGNATDNGLSVVRNIYEDGSLEALGDISELYGSMRSGPGFINEGGPMMAAMSTMSAMEVQSSDLPVIGKYLVPLSKDMLGGNYIYDGVTSIVCEELGLVLVYDWEMKDWLVWTGDTHIEYLIEFRLKKLYDPLDGKACPVLNGKDINEDWIYTDFNVLTANNLKLIPNTVHPDKFELSWINRVRSSMNNMVKTGYVFMSQSLPSASSLEKHLSERKRLDETYISIPVMGVTVETLAITINSEPAILNLTNYGAEDKEHLASAVYMVTDVAEDNVYPTRGSRGSFTAQNHYGQVHYDVATGCWTLVGSTANKPITVGLTSLYIMDGPGCTIGTPEYLTAPGLSIYTYSMNPGVDKSVAFRLSGLPMVTTDPEVLDLPDLSEEFLNFEHLPGGEIPLPNYELFDPADFELVVVGHDGVKTTSNAVVETDTHGTPIAYRWLVSVELQMLIGIDVVNRQPIMELHNFDAFTDPTYGALPLARTDRLTENPETMIFLKQMKVAMQWNYTKLLDYTDTRPLFLGMDSNSIIYLDPNGKGFASAVVAQGSKKRAALGFAVCPNPDDGKISGKSNQPFFGWMPTGYTGVPFNVRDSGFVVDAEPGVPLNGMPSHSAETTLEISGQSNYEPS